MPIIAFLYTAYLTNLWNKNIGLSTLKWLIITEIYFILNLVFGTILHFIWVVDWETEPDKIVLIST